MIESDIGRKKCTVDGSDLKSGGKNELNMSMLRMFDYGTLSTFSIFTILRDNYLEVRCIRGPLLYELKLKLESKALEQQHLAPTT